MKKLTAGILTVLLGIVSANSADAAVASKGYVDAKAAAEAAAAKQAAEDTAAGALSGAKSELESKINTKVEQSVYNAKVAELETADTNISNLVGTLPEGEASVVAYIDKKTTGIATDAALSGLTDRVTTAESDIDSLEEKVGTKSVAAQIAEAVIQESQVSGLTDALGGKQDKSEKVKTITDFNDAVESGNSEVYPSVLAVQAAIDQGIGDKQGTLTPGKFIDISDKNVITTTLEGSQTVNIDQTSGAISVVANSIGSDQLSEAVDADIAKGVAADTLSKSNKTEIDAINNANTGILKQAQDYADDAEADAIDAAKTETQTQITALALKAISQVPAECSAMDKYCALTYGTDGYVWEVIERATGEQLGTEDRTVTGIKPTQGN